MRRRQCVCRYTWQWGGRGGPVAHEQGKLQEEGTEKDCAMVSVSYSPQITPIACYLPTNLPGGFVCMRRNAHRPVAVDGELN